MERPDIEKIKATLAFNYPNDFWKIKEVFDYLEELEKMKVK